MRRVVAEHSLSSKAAKAPAMHRDELRLVPPLNCDGVPPIIARAAFTFDQTFDERADRRIVSSTSRNAGDSPMMFSSP